MGDPSIHVYSKRTGQTWSYPRAKRPSISSNSQYVVFAIPPAEDAVKALKRAKTKKKDMPKDSLGILDLSTMQLQKIADVKRHSLPSKWDDWLIYHLSPQVAPKDTSATALKPKKESTSNGSKLIVHDLEDNYIDTIPYVTDYSLAEEGAALAVMSTGKKDSTLLQGVYSYDFGYRSLVTVFDTHGEYTKMTWDKGGTQLAFIADCDTSEARVRPYELYTWKNRGTKAAKVNTESFSRQGYPLSHNGSLRYSNDGSRLFFGIAAPPVLQDTSILDEEIVNVEVWNYKDGRLYTQQENNKRRDIADTYLCMLDIKSNSIKQIETPDLPESAMTRDRQERYVVVYDERPYQHMRTWESFILQNAYLLDLQTGNRSVIGEGISGRISLSPQGKYAYWYSMPDTAWYAHNVMTKKTVQLTSNAIGPFYDETNDRPMSPWPAGSAGWNTDESAFFIYDRYDIWNFDPSGQRDPQRLTNGRSQNTRYRYIRLDNEQQHIDTKTNGMVNMFNFDTKEAGLGHLDWSTGKVNLDISGPYNFNSRAIRKAKRSDDLVFTKEDYQTFPDLIISNTAFRSPKTISNANPQQSEYNWGSIELVEFNTLDGIPVKGMLVKPEGFDPAKKYPMIVNFYEKSSDGLHNHRAPFPHRSTINYSFYASKGYLIFNPDIPYKDGYPGESCFNAVMPGVAKLVDMGFVDEDNIGLQGHSWGGYQIAYLVTRTNMFKCAESGAPVVNMFSAYGGIRWGSGLSRMFQYERTQSRIGGTIWDLPLRYLENSPIFFIDKINTPVLILHNDEDGAVPWYQGIEFFGAMRRLGKPAWMLNYNGEPHWPVKLQNRRDFNVRMQQFFDHYLMGSPMPKWMDEGVSPINKGINQGLELMRQ